MQSMVDVDFDEGTGTFVFTRKDGSEVTIETKISKIATNWEYDAETKSLILYLDDGTEQHVDLSALITQLDFIDSETITFTVSTDGKVTARIKKGSITGEYLDPDYLAGIVTNVATAKEYMEAAGESALDARRWAVGDPANYPGSELDNAKKYAEDAAKSAALAEQTVNINLPQVYVDMETMELMGKMSGYMLYLDDDGMLWGGVESA